MPTGRFIMSKPINLDTLELRLRRGDTVSTEALISVVAEMRAQREVAKIARQIDLDASLAPNVDALKKALAKLDTVWR